MNYTFSTVNDAMPGTGLFPGDFPTKGNHSRALRLLFNQCLTKQGCANGQRRADTTERLPSCGNLLIHYFDQFFQFGCSEYVVLHVEYLAIEEFFRLVPYFL